MSARRDIEMGDRPYASAVDRLQLDPVRERRDERRGVLHLPDDDVRLDQAGVETRARELREAVGEDPGVLVVLGEAVDVMVECVQAAGGDDAGLAE